LHVGPTLRSANRGGQRHEDHLDQLVVPATVDSGIGNFFEMLPYARCRTTTHRTPPCRKNRPRPSEGLTGTDFKQSLDHSRATCDCPGMRLARWCESTHGNL